MNIYQFLDQVLLNLYRAHLPTSFERFRCALNRKQSKFERNLLILSTDPLESRQWFEMGGLNAERC